MNARECVAIEFLAQAAKSIMSAKRATGNGLVDDHCVNALREIQHALNTAVNDSADEIS